MSDGTTRDIERLQKMFEELDPKYRRSALRGAMRDSARKVRKAAVARLRSASDRITSNKMLEKGIRAVSYKKVLGFKVTIMFDKKRRLGFYLSRRRAGKKNASPKPVLLFSEGGTIQRKTRGHGWLRRGKRPTGKMPASLFMRDAKREMTPKVTADIHDSLEKYVTKTAKKHGIM